MRPIKYQVDLTEEDRLFLLDIVNDPQVVERKILRANTLLKIDEGMRDGDVAKALRINIATVALTRKRFAQGGREKALMVYKRPEPGQRRKVNEQTEQTLISLLQQPPTNGKKRWTLHLLESQMRMADKENAISHETIRLTLRRLNLSLR